MGREIRRVPPNWEHPRYTADDAPYKQHVGEYRPCYDDSYEHARDEWIRGFDLWRAGKHEEQIANPDACWVKGYDWWEYDSPPDRTSYRPAFTEEPTWFQVYETVSEGTPVTPAFATTEELIDYLCTRGDFWCQNRRERPPTREAAEAFVKSGWVPSMIVVNNKSGKVTIKEGIDAAI